MNQDLKPGVAPVEGYTLIERLGRGGFGEVWKATGPGGFHVALKFVLLGEDIGTVELRALEVIKHIRHPHLLGTFGAWQDEGQLIIAMELADRTLLDRFREAVGQGFPGIPAPEIFEHFIDAAKGLDYLNEPRHPTGGSGPQGIQHRDIKPQNLLLVGGSVKVADFGLARVLEHSTTGHTGSMTPSYAAPEFFDGKTSSQSDQYSLAITYCHLRGGRLPFEGLPAAVIAGHVMREPDLSMIPEVERPAVARALAKAPRDRWPSCRAFVQAVEDAAEGRAPSPEVGMREAPPTLDPGRSRPSKPKVTMRDSPPSTERRDSGPGDRGVSVPSGKGYQGEFDSFSGTKGDSRPVQPEDRHRSPHKNKALALASVGLMVVILFFFWKSSKPDGASAVTVVPEGPSNVVGEPSRPLFNGKDLTGWTIDGNSQGGWSVESGEIVGRGGGGKAQTKSQARNYLLSDKDYGDFILRLEFNLTENGSAGIVLRGVPGEHMPRPRGDAVIDHPNFKLTDGRPDEPTGTLYYVIAHMNPGPFGLAAKPSRRAPTKRAGTWNRLRIEVKGHSMKASVNDLDFLDVSLDPGATFPDGTIPALNRVKGRVGLARQAGTVKFRKIEIEVLGRLALIGLAGIEVADVLHNPFERGHSL